MKNLPVSVPVSKALITYKNYCNYSVMCINSTQIYCWYISFKQEKCLKNNLQKVLAYLGKIRVGKQGMGTAQWHSFKQTLSISSQLCLRGI